MTTFDFLNFARLRRAARAARYGRAALACLAAFGLVGGGLVGGAGAEAGGDPVAADCAEATARRVQAHYDEVRDLSADFAQTTRSVAFGGASAVDSEPARGRVHFAKPGRMRWEYRSPEPSLVVSDGETLWIHDPVAKEVQVLAVGAGFLSGAAIQFLLGEGKILESFRVAASSCEGERVTLALHPRQPATYERLELVVDPASGVIRETEVVDLFGNRTHVVFEDMDTNQDPPVTLFRFEPPEGVRVLELPKNP